MENYASLIGVAIAIALRAVVWKSADTLLKKFASFVLILVVSGASAFAASYGARLLRSQLNKPSQVENTLAQLKKAPLIGVILQDNPQAETELREVIRSDIDAGTSFRSRAMLSELWSKYAMSATFGASDETVLAAWTAQTTLMRHLKGTNIKICREYFVAGIQNSNELDAHGKGLVNSALRAQEAMYLNGRGKPPRSKAMTDDDFAKLLEILAFTPTELQQLDQQTLVSDSDLCNVGLKLYDGVLTKVHRDSQPYVARHFLANS